MKKQEIEKDETKQMKIIKDICANKKCGYVKYFYDNENRLDEIRKEFFNIGSLSKEKEVLKILDELNKKYPSQCSGEIGIKWNDEFRKMIKSK